MQTHEPLTKIYIALVHIKIEGKSIEDAEKILKDKLNQPLTGKEWWIEDVFISS